MGNSKRHKTESSPNIVESTESGTYSESVSLESSSDEIVYEVADLSVSNWTDVSILMDQSRMFPSSEEFLSLFVNSKVLVSGDLILSFCGFLEVPKVLEMIHKKLREALSSLISTAEKNKIKSSEVYIFYMERAANLPLEMILSLYRSLSLGRFKYMIFVSRVKPCGKREVKNLMEDFKEYNPVDLSHIPVRGEEILLLSSHIAKKQIGMNNNIFRLFLMDRKMFESFIKLFEKEISKSI
ncbi:uncharacterized protein Eint_041310 [Encephalitozoon intestinalis ATCC 50506]|uniref:Uncharacterized protein n=1 Tax=Encephalitozoon intestinalis (strain ATCC 50506) TaxID=876142 RepID=E0S6T5_ENCIT|nr:uncharacterized protein Eint_041310 [Encephalitozoon intestinalis ATCC 50506]ADM11420.1 hypothetical protein Eint_041310 [Encephalitozoon intestinalis ATCC 50506]UTX45112.1 ribosome biogenesis GTP-binding protein YsxC [Encephalitozoon intestinalis]